MTVDGRTAFVSGAASGIGRAMARRLARHGCPVAIADQDEAGLKETASLIPGPSPWIDCRAGDPEPPSGGGGDVEPLARADAGRARV